MFILKFLVPNKKYKKFEKRLIKGKKIRDYDGHNERVGALSVFRDLLLSGSRDSKLLLRDLRSPQSPVLEFNGPRQEICGLKWSPDGEYFASGSNDNSMMVFSPKTRFPIMKKSHRAAVKAIAWSPRQVGILASGGGTADCRLRLWNVRKQALLDEVDTGSQVCSVMFSPHHNEIISTHGFSQYEVAVWRTPKLRRITALTGHTRRVLYQSMSPCGNYVVTGAGDETLRFWDLSNKTEQVIDYKHRHKWSKVQGQKKNRIKKKKRKGKELQIPVLR